MLSLLAFIFVLSALILAHEFGHFIIAKRHGVRVEIFSLGFGPQILGFERNHTRYVLSLIPLGGYIKMAGENPDQEIKGEPWEYLSKSVLQRASIVLAGPILNYLLAFLIFSLVFIIGTPTLSSRVGEVMEGYPAKERGILAGDRITAIDGKGVVYWEEMAGTIHKRIEGRPLVLTIVRESQAFEVSVVPRVEERENIFGQRLRIGLIGIKPSDEIIKARYNPLFSLYLSSRKVIALTNLTYRLIWNLVTGGISLRESVTGPIGIFVITGQVARLGFIYLANFLAALSITLAIINLLPIPVLDGGHIIFLALECIKGRQLSQKIQGVASQIGLFLLIALMLFIFYNDLIRFGLLDKIAHWKKETGYFFQREDREKGWENNEKK